MRTSTDQHRLKCIDWDTDNNALAAREQAGERRCVINAFEARLRGNNPAIMTSAPL